MVEHSIGNGEVESSILSRSTSLLPKMGTKTRLPTHKNQTKTWRSDAFIRALLQTHSSALHTNFLAQRTAASQMSGCFRISGPKPQIIEIKQKACWLTVTISILFSLKKNGAPERIRTSDPQIRSLVLYPAELRVLACAASAAAMGG